MGIIAALGQWDVPKFSVRPAIREDSRRLPGRPAKGHQAVMSRTPGLLAARIRRFIFRYVDIVAIKVVVAPRGGSLAAQRPTATLRTLL